MHTLSNHPAHTQARIHPTALIEEGVIIGAGSSIWDHAHLRKNARIGCQSTIGEKSYIAYNVSIGDYVKINAFVYVCAQVTIEDQCLIGAGTVFTNDLFPRAMNKELTALEVSEPTADTLFTRVQQGASIGANATIGPGVEIGCYAMVGMGSVVTRDIPAQGLAIGNPARVIGYVCLCGPKLIDLNRSPKPGSTIECPRCRRNYLWKNLTIQRIDSKNLGEYGYK